MCEPEAPALWRRGTTGIYTSACHPVSLQIHMRLSANTPSTCAKQFAENIHLDARLDPMAKSNKGAGDSRGGGMTVGATGDSRGQQVIVGADCGNC